MIGDGAAKNAISSRLEVAPVHSNPIVKARNSNSRSLAPAVASAHLPGNVATSVRLINRPHLRKAEMAFSVCKMHYPVG